MTGADTLEPAEEAVALDLDLWRMQVREQAFQDAKRALYPYLESLSKALTNAMERYPTDTSLWTPDQINEHRILSAKLEQMRRAVILVEDLAIEAQHLARGAHARRHP